MIDESIKVQINSIDEYVKRINEIMQALHDKNVEIKILYKDALLNKPPVLELWKATEHIDYLKQ